ncbi:MAG: hypothetical protein AAF945_04700 [Actinomycetota bacterium]
MTTINTPDSASDSTSSTATTDAAVGRLRLVLRLNALSSLASGLILSIAPNTVDDLLDTGRPGIVRLVGLGLIPFAVAVAWLSTAHVNQLRRHTPGIIVGDVAWVVASIVTIVLGWYSMGGAIAVAAMAALVDVWAVLQWRSLTSIRRGS